MEYNFEKNHFFIIFENSNVHNFSSNEDGKMRFTELKRANFFLPITLIQLMCHKNKFLNNSTKMMEIEGFSECSLKKLKRNQENFF